MIRKIKISIILTLFFSLFFINFNVVKASNATTYTMELNQKGKLVRTQDAYLPEGVLIDIQLNKPDDMIFDDLGFLWIADTGNKRVIKIDTKTNKIIEELTHIDFVDPRGIFINKLGIYVADSSAEKIFRFDNNLELIEVFGKPDSPSFKDISFKPSKIAVDNKGSIYIYSQGVSNGIIQLTSSGEFLGFFTTNKVKLSLTQQFYKKILSKDQFDRLVSRTPQNFSSIFIDNNSMIYTTTMNSKDNGVKKHNMQGGNIFNSTLSYNDARDIYVDSRGIIYAGMQSGTIFVYNQSGEFIFALGTSENSSNYIEDDISGVFKKLSAIAVRDDGYIFALDDEKSFLQIFKPTLYTNKIFEALDMYENRKYSDAIDLWNEVLRLNQMSVIAHNNIAKSYLQLQDYEKANHHFKISANRVGYSESFWELRNNIIQQSLQIILLAGIILYIGIKSMKIVDNKTMIFTNQKNKIKKKLDFKIFKDLLFTFKVMKSPENSFYELKRNEKGSLLGAIIIHILLYLSFILYNIGKGFIYQEASAVNMDLPLLTLGFFVITFLLVLVNYLDTSLHDGIGSIKNIYIMFIYSLGPLLLSFTFTTILSHVLTLNETFFLDFIMLIGFIWSGALIYIGIAETHQYTMKETVKSIFMSILFLIIIMIVIIIMITMWKQLYVFIDSIIEELIRNVFS